MSDLPDPPAARRDDVVDHVHGVAVPDPYRWLEDAEAPETRAWVAAHNARTRAVLDADPGRPMLVDRFTELFSAGTRGGAVDPGRAVVLDRPVGRAGAGGARRPGRPRRPGAAGPDADRPPRADRRPDRRPRLVRPQPRRLAGRLRHLDRRGRALHPRRRRRGHRRAAGRHHPPHPGRLGRLGAGRQGVRLHPLPRPRGGGRGGGQLPPHRLVARPRRRPRPRRAGVRRPARQDRLGVGRAVPRRPLAAGGAVARLDPDRRPPDRPLDRRPDDGDRGRRRPVVVHRRGRAPGRDDHPRRTPGPGRGRAGDLPHRRPLADRRGRVDRRHRGRDGHRRLAAGGVDPVGAQPSGPPAARRPRCDRRRPARRPGGADRDPAARAGLAGRDGRRPRQRDGGGGVHLVGPAPRAVALVAGAGTGRRRPAGPVERPPLPRRPVGLHRDRRAVPVDRRHRGHAVHGPPGRHPTRDRRRRRCSPATAGSR